LIFCLGAEIFKFKVACTKLVVERNSDHLSEDRLCEWVWQWLIMQDYSQTLVCLLVQSLADGWSRNLARGFICIFPCCKKCPSSSFLFKLFELFIIKTSIFCVSQFPCGGFLYIFFYSFILFTFFLIYFYSVKVFKKCPLWSIAFTVCLFFHSEIWKRLFLIVYGQSTCFESFVKIKPNMTAQEEVSHKQILHKQKLVFL